MAGSREVSATPTGDQAIWKKLQNPAVSLVLIISQRCRASLGTCSSRKTKWQLCNLSLWHIMETQKPEVIQLSPFQLQAEASWVSPIFTSTCNGLIATFVPVHVSDHTTYCFLFLSSTLFLSNKVQNSFHSKVLVLQSQPNNAGSSPPPNEYHLWASWQKDTERFTFLFQEVEFSLKVWTNHWMKQNFTVIIMWANTVLWSRRIWL